jgi:transcriptional regulator with XRE-family HTH domain
MTTAQPADDPGQARLLPLPGDGPTVLRMALGGQLRRLRQDRGISREAAGEAIRASHAKISRLELGRVGFKERDLTDLLTLYGVTDPAERDAFLTLARQANTPGWWHQYGDLLPSWFETYLGLEQATTIIRSFEAQFIPGLLQTPDYARAVILLGHGQEPADEIDRRVALRMRRQAILTRTDPPNLWVVLDEAALHRPFGGVPVLRAQIEHLIQATELPNVTVQLLPFHVGGHAAAGGPFTILRFPESDLPDIVYLEQLTSALYLDKRQNLDRYLAVMDRLSVQAEPPEQSSRILTTLLAEL